MKAAVILLCLVVAVAAKPQFGGGFGGASGFGNSGSLQAQTSGLFGNTAIQRSEANAGVSITTAFYIQNTVPS